VALPDSQLPPDQVRHTAPGARRCSRATAPVRPAWLPGPRAGQSAGHAACGLSGCTRQQLSWPGGRRPRWSSACTSGTRCAGLVVKPG